MSESKTSQMQALSNPARWGLVRVQILFGQINHCRNQTTITGNLLLDPQTGIVYVFHWREGENLGVSTFDW